MKRKLSVVLIFVSISAVLGIFYYQWNRPTPRKTVSPKPIAHFLPKQIQTVSFLELDSESLEKFGSLELIQKLRKSPFQQAFENRIVPLIKLSINRIKANHPYPSRYVMRYFIGGRLLYFSGPDQPGVLVADLTSNSKKNFRSLLKEWLISPAKDRTRWDVSKQMYQGVSLWSLTYELPGLNRKLSIELAYHHNYLLVSNTTKALKKILARYRNLKSAHHEWLPAQMTRGSSLKIIALNSPLGDMSKRPDRLSDLLKKYGGDRYKLSSSGRFWRLEVRTSRTVPGNVGSDGLTSDTTLLKYSPDTASLIVHSNVHGSLPRKSLILQSMLPDTLYDLLSPLVKKRIFSSVNYTLLKSYRSNKTQLEPLVVLNIRDRGAFERKFQDFIARTEDKYEFTWDGTNLLLSTKVRIVERALKRFEHRRGFPGDGQNERLVQRLKGPYRTFVYTSSSSLSNRFHFPEELHSSNRKLIRLLFGFDPTNEFGKVVSTLPGSYLTISSSGDSLATIELMTAGDVFLPLLMEKRYTDSDSLVPSSGRGPWMRFNDWLNRLGTQKLN